MHKEVTLRGRGSAARAAAVRERGEGESAESVEDLAEAVDSDVESPRGQLSVPLPRGARVGRQEMLWGGGDITNCR